VRILFVTPELPNGLHRIRALNLVRGLSQRHEIDLVSLAHRTPSPEAVEVVRPYCRRIDWVLQPRWRSLAQSALGLFRSAPLEAAYERSPVLARLLRERLAERSYDLLYIKRLRMAQYGLAVDGLPRVLDLTDSMTRFYEQSWRRAPWPAKVLFWEEWRKHRGYEARVAQRFERCVIASQADLDYLQCNSGLRNIEVVPNAVDTEFFRPQPDTEEPATFVLSGLMDKLVNIDAALYLCGEIWPRVRVRVPGARLRLVGPNPSPAVRALDGQPGVEVVGYAADLRDELARATAVLVPLRMGTGTKNKILQSLAMARPVVTTSAGNEGLGAISGQHLLVADSAESFAAAILRLHADPAWRTALGAAGQDWVVDRYGIPAILEQLECVLQDVIGRPDRAVSGAAM